MTATIERRLSDLERRAAERSNPTSCPACGYAWGYRVTDAAPVVTRCFRCDSPMPAAAVSVGRYRFVSPNQL